MKDEAITVDETQPLAHQAVSYVLKRMKVDANLRWYMLHTEAFARLCAAEAMLTGKKPDDVEDFYSEPLEHCKGDVADVVTLRAKVEKLEEDSTRQAWISSNHDRRR